MSRLALDLFLQTLKLGLDLLHRLSPNIGVLAEQVLLPTLPHHNWRTTVDMCRHEDLDWVGVDPIVRNIAPGEHFLYTGRRRVKFLEAAIAIAALQE